MGSVYPELTKQRAHIETVTRAEEERFFDTIEGGLERLDELQGTKVISGEDAFKLYDTYGFPIDLTQLRAAERGQTVDVDGFEGALGAQRERSREDRGAQGRRAPAVRLTRPGEWRTVKPKKKQKWVGYETTKAETDVLRFRQADDRVEVVLEDNPFYAESGGQVSDTRQMKYKDAIARGAIAFFTEKYGDIVRVVDVPGVSLELCGGTHVPATGQIALFRFTHETGAAAGIRRIEAVTGPAAYALVRKLEQQVAE